MKWVNNQYYNEIISENSNVIYENNVFKIVEAIYNNKLFNFVVCITNPINHIPFLISRQEKIDILNDNCINSYEDLIKLDK